MALIIFDIDGTLKPYHRKIPKSAYQAIETLKQKGHTIGIASGRGMKEVQTVIHDFGIKHYICNGGSQVVVNGETIYDQYLDPQDVKAMATYLRTHKMSYFMYNNNASYSSYLPNYVKYFFMLGIPFIKSGWIDKTIGIASYLLNVTSAEIIDEELFDFSNIKKIMFLSNKIKEKKFFDYRLNTHAFFHLIEFECKEKGIDILLKETNEEQVIVFGDGDNDLSMFEHADIKIAMGNGKQCLKEKATFITKKAHEDGIFYACEHFNYFV